MVIVQYDVAVFFVKIIGQLEQEVNVSRMVEARRGRGGCVKAPDGSGDLVNDRREYAGEIMLISSRSG